MSRVSGPFRRSASRVARASREWSARLALAGAMLVMLVVAAGCKADFEVTIEIDNDGSGTVMTEIVLDQEASDALLDLDPGQTLPLTDLAQAGWEIGRPVREETGQTRITATKAFGTPAQFSAVMSELAHDGVIRDFGLTREQSFGRVDYAVTGVIDPSEGLFAFTDPELEAALGRPLVSVAEGPPYNLSEDDISIGVTVKMPGELQEDGSTGRVVGNATRPRVVWSTVLSDRQPVDVVVRTARRSTSAQVLRGVAVVAGVLAGLVAFGQLLRIAGGLGRRKPAAKVRPTDARGRPAGTGKKQRSPAKGSAAAVEDQAEAEPVNYKVVALDGMGVLYREGNDVRELLIPFARQRGSTAPDDEIVAKARQLSLGRMTPADFWRIVGVDGDPNDLDAAYLALHQLTPGVVKYLRSLRDRKVRAACITNDASAWAMKLRAGHSLEGLIDPWVISGSVGVRKPDPPLFEVLRRVTGEPPSAILVIDDDLANLDAARDLGFGTAWFSATGNPVDARGHDILRSFLGSAVLVSTQDETVTTE